jgi:hypothetical protein
MITIGELKMEDGWLGFLIFIFLFTIGVNACFMYNIFRVQFEKFEYYRKMNPYLKRFLTGLLSLLFFWVGCIISAFTVVFVWPGMLVGLMITQCYTCFKEAEKENEEREKIKNEVKAMNEYKSEVPANLV